MLHPTLGRFVNRDPIGYNQRPNLYAYTMCGPIGSVDPSGCVTFKNGQPVFDNANRDPSHRIGNTFDADYSFSLGPADLPILLQEVRAEGVLEVVHDFGSVTVGFTVQYIEAWARDNRSTRVHTIPDNHTIRPTDLAVYVARLVEGRQFAKMGTADSLFLSKGRASSWPLCEVTSWKYRAEATFDMRDATHAQVWSVPPDSSKFIGRALLDFTPTTKGTLHGNAVTQPPGPGYPFKPPLVPAGPQIPVEGWVSGGFRAVSKETYEITWTKGQAKPEGNFTGVGYEVQPRAGAP